MLSNNHFFVSACLKITQLLSTAMLTQQPLHHAQATSAFLHSALFKRSLSKHAVAESAQVSSFVTEFISIHKHGQLNVCVGPEVLRGLGGQWVTLPGNDHQNNPDKAQVQEFQQGHKLTASSQTQCTGNNRHWSKNGWRERNPIFVFRVHISQELTHPVCICSLPVTSPHTTLCPSVTAVKSRVSSHLRTIRLAGTLVNHTTKRPVPDIQLQIVSSTER